MGNHTQTRIELTPETLRGFTESVLASRYHNPKAVPKFHDELWAYCCSNHPRVAIAAPREHAKSTAVTGAFVIARLMFRLSEHVLIISSNEEIASGFLNDIKVELLENELLAQTFGFSKFLKEAESELVGVFNDGSKFRVIAKGAGQRMRGIKWERKRPDLVVGDDMEDDEIVMNKERREKFRRWFSGAVLPIVSDGGLIRIVGTILHMDSFLESLMPDPKLPMTVVEPLKTHSLDRKPVWLAVKYRAHNVSTPEASTLFLWPEQWPKDRLMEKYQHFWAQGLLDVYAQEYLNDPIDESTAYFKEEYFTDVPRNDENFKRRHKRYYAAIDLAISTKSGSDYTAIAVAAYDSEGKLEFCHIRKGRWDAKEIMENMFEVQKRYSPELFVIEKGNLEKAIGPFLHSEMRRRQLYLNLYPMGGSYQGDKESRARSLQGRMRMGDVFFDHQATWYPDVYEELRRFPRAKHDDIVDAMSYIGLLLQNMIPAPTDEEWDDERKAEDRWLRDEAISDSLAAQSPSGGVNPVTGY